MEIEIRMSIFRLEQGVSISWLLLSVSRKKPGTNKDQKAMKPITVNIKALFGRFCYASPTPPPPLPDPPTALFLHSKLLTLKLSSLFKHGKIHQALIIKATTYYENLRIQVNLQ